MAWINSLKEQTMLAQLTSTTLNPNQAPWFNKAHPETMKNLSAWIKEHPGLIHISGKALNPTTWENILIFESEEAANSFLEAEHEHKTARIEYNEANGMTVMPNMTLLLY